MERSIFKFKVQWKLTVLSVVMLFLTQLSLADPAQELKEYYLNRDKEITVPSYTPERTVINFNQEKINTNHDTVTQVTGKFEDNTSPSWYPFMHLTGKAGDGRQLGRFDFMNPLWQSPNSMFFSDIRCTFDNEDSVEGNMGMGFRRIIPGKNENADWIWGIYGFYDILKSPNGNKFNQGTFGIEMLKSNFELRGNIYIPENKKYEIANRTIESITLSGTSVMQRTQSLAAFERALPGIDAQVGYGFDISEKDKLWIHAGYFNFNHDDSPEIAGPRLSLTYELNDVFGIPDSTLNIGAEYQNDDVRDTRTFACISLSIPFGTTFERLMKTGQRQNIKSRMMRPVVRDVDVITSSDNINGEPGSKDGPEVISDTEAPVVDTASGELVDMYFISANGSSAGLGTQENPMTIVQAQNASGASDILFLINDDGGIDVNSISGGTLTLKPYQQIFGIGDNTSRDILLPNDLTLTVYSETGRPSLTHPGYVDVVKMVYNNTIDGITISGGGNGIYGQNVSNPSIRDVTISDANNYAVYLTNASANVTISGSDLQNNNLGAVYLSSTTGGSTNLSMLNNNISNNIDRGFYAVNTNGSTLTGNIENNTISGNGTQGMYIYNTTNGVTDIDIIGNQITGNTNEGLRLFNYTGGTITTTVQNNLISENQDDNIYCYNNASTMNLVMNNNNILNSPIDLGVRIYNISNGSVFSGNITNNTISGNINQGLYMYNTGSAFEVTARNNTITGNQAGGIDYDTDAGTSTLTIENNIISNNIGGASSNDIGISINQDTDPNSTLTLTLNNNVVADNGYTGIRLDNADGGSFDASLTGNTVNNNGTDGVYVINQTTGILTAEFSDNTIIQNSARGLWLYNNTGTMNSKLENNTIAMNTSDGLELDNINSGIFDFDLGGGTLSSAGLNSIFANISGYDIDNDTGVSISAENNWWGTVSPNPARFAGTVDFDPWLTSDPN